MFYISNLIGADHFLASLFLMMKVINLSMLVVVITGEIAWVVWREGGLAGTPIITLEEEILLQLLSSNYQTPPSPPLFSGPRQTKQITAHRSN